MRLTPHSWRGLHGRQEPEKQICDETMPQDHARTDVFIYVMRMCLSSLIPHEVACICHSDTLYKNAAMPGDLQFISMQSR